MKTNDMADENFKKLQQLFPEAVTETMVDGEVVRAIDKDVLQQLISTTVVDGAQERYQFTWPDKRNAIRLASESINKTLRPCREESVDFDTTENLYIEGDNLDVLKLLQETYLGKIKMIYIDPPYNTGHDFVYDDSFDMSAEEYSEVSGEFDEENQRLVQNLDSNGRFHTDWLNMLYPRLKIAKNLLSDDGVIFVSIDNNEISNAKKLCDELFGTDNLLGVISNTNNPKGRSDDKYIATAHEYILVYSKNSNKTDWFGFEPTDKILKRYNKTDSNGNKYREIDLRKTGENDLREDRPNLFYYFYYNEETKDFYPDRNNYNREGYVQIKPLREDGREGNWRWGFETTIKQISELTPKFMPNRKIWGVMEKDYLEGRALVKPTSSWTFKDVNSERGSEDFVALGFDKNIFSKPKPLGTIKRCLKLSTAKNDLILDFFSGSATSAHAVMQLNAEDGGNRKFIMVQLPEETDEKSEAYKAGYKNICEIGNERIRRAGAKIKEENPLTTADLDTGFRVLKLDSSNMKDVYYNPGDLDFASLDDLVSNIKEDRTPEDLLFQVMLELGVLPSSKILETEIAGKKVFDVAENFLIACFDENITEEVITEIAKKKPYYFVMRDNSMASDSVATNFEQIFATYSPETVRKVL